MLESRLITSTPEDQLTELDEVIVTPYNLRGEIAKDIGRLKTNPALLAESLGLPNAHVPIPTQVERQLFEATSGGASSPVNLILNGISGLTKMLKVRVARNKLYEGTLKVRDFYADALYRTKLRIPIDKIDDFLYSC